MNNIYIENENEIGSDGFFLLNKVLSAKTILEHQELFNEHEINAAKYILIHHVI